MPPEKELFSLWKEGGEGSGRLPVSRNKVGWKGDSLWVFDSQNLRFTLFPPGRKGSGPTLAQMGVQPSEGTDLPSFGSSQTDRSSDLRVDAGDSAPVRAPPIGWGNTEMFGFVGPEGNRRSRRSLPCSDCRRFYSSWGPGPECRAAGLV